MPSSKSYESLIAQIERLQHEAAILRERQKKPILAAIAQAIHHYEITLPELRGAVSSTAPRGAGKAIRLGGGRDVTHPLTGRKVPAKFKNPKTGETWSGRGSTPKWLSEAEAAGAKRESFLIKRGKG